MEEITEEKSVAASNGGPLTEENSTCRPLAMGEDKRLLSVTEFCKEFNIAKSVVYMLITQDPSFPVVNIGFKKKYLICMENIESWAFKRMYQEQLSNHRVPSLLKILNKTRKNDEELQS